MEDFLRIFKWFEKNMFKLIFTLLGMIIICTIVMFLIPIFQIISLVGEGASEVQNIFEGIEKYIKEFQWEKKPAKNPYDDGQA